MPAKQRGKLSKNVFTLKERSLQFFSCGFWVCGLCAALSLVIPPWITRGCGGSTLAMARHWKLTSTSTRYAFAWAALVLWNPSHAPPPATRAFWTQARRTPPVAPSVRPRVGTTQCLLLFMQLHSSAITPLKWRFLASFQARTKAR